MLKNWMNNATNKRYKMRMFRSVEQLIQSKKNNKCN